MTKNETIQLLTLLASNYKNIDDKLKEKDKVKMLLETWYECLSDLDVNLCMIAAKKAIMTSQYPPTIHEIRKAATEIVTPATENTSAIELWDEALKMIKKGSYMTDAEFETHSPVVKQFFGCVGQLRELGMTEVDKIGVLKGQFLKQIDVLQTRKKEQDLLPQSMRETINQIAMNINKIAINKAQAKQIEGEIK